jgi:TPR repeat protein
MPLAIAVASVEEPSARRLATSVGSDARPTEAPQLHPVSVMLPEHSSKTVTAPSPTVQTAPAAPPGPAAATAEKQVDSAALSLSPGAIAALLRRGDELMSLRDIAAARLLYERAARAGDAAAATKAGKTYDPLFLADIGTRGIRGDRAAAAEWYRKASNLGDAEAQRRLQTLSQSSVN